MNRKSKIIILSGLAVTSTLYLIYNNIRKNQIFGEISALIASGNTQGNNNVNLALDGNFHKKIQNENPNRGFIRLNDSAVQNLVKELNEALKGLGTDESKLNSIIEGLKDKVQLSQISSYYNAKYGKSFREALKDDLSNDDYLEIIIIPMNKKIDVRWA